MDAILTFSKNSWCCKHGNSPLRTAKDHRRNVTAVWKDSWIQTILNTKKDLKSVFKKSPQWKPNACCKQSFCQSITLFISHARHYIQKKNVNKCHFTAQESYRNLIWKNMLNGTKLQTQQMLSYIEQSIKQTSKQTNKDSITWKWRMHRMFSSQNVYSWSHCDPEDLEGNLFSNNKPLTLSSFTRNG